MVSFHQKNFLVTPIHHWEGPFVNIWKSCISVGEKKQRDLELCKADCLQKKQCNAINFKEGVDGECVLLSCRKCLESASCYEVPPPEHKIEGYTGYCVKRKLGNFMVVITRGEL